MTRQLMLKRPDAVRVPGATYPLGGVGDTWGRTWTIANVATPFQVRLTNVSSSGASDFFLDWVTAV